MSTVRELTPRKGRQIFSIPPAATVLEALTMMDEHNLGALMVVTDGQVDGILSERDCVRKLDLVGRSARDTLVKDIMTSKVIYIEAGQPLEECMALMLEKSVP